jgi:hypothetical protein
MPTTTDKSSTKANSERTATEGAAEGTESLHHLIAGIQKSEKSALEAVKRFVDTVNEAFPDISEDGPRQQIIDAAFKMTDQVVEASNKLASNLVDVTENTVGGLTGSSY